MNILNKFFIGRSRKNGEEIIIQPGAYDVIRELVDQGLIAVEDGEYEKGTEQIIEEDSR